MTLRPHSELNLYFAACVPDGGVYHYRSHSGRLEFVKKYQLDRPMYLCAAGGHMYVLLREPFEGSTDSGLFDYKIAADGSLIDPTEPISTGGRCACHLSMSRGRIYATNYLSGSVVSVDSDKNVRLATHSGKGSHPTRQEAPHTHFVRESPDGKCLFAVDLGVDKIYIYDHELNCLGVAAVPSGAGCRHLDYSPDGRYVFCANELASTVTVLRYTDCQLEPLYTVPALPVDYTGESTCAAIRVSSDGKTLYVSNRGHDSVCAYKLSDGILSDPVWTKICGVSPRDFIIADGIMYVTNEKTNNVTLFNVDGRELTKLDYELEMPNPLCVVYTYAQI